MQFSEISSLEEKYQLTTYKKFPFSVERGQGVWVYTSEGERYLDLYGGHAVTATGHSHPLLVKALTEQATKLLFYSNLVYSSIRARAAERLVWVAPEGLTKAFFANSGTEANENAMRMARLATGREKILSFTGGFHGRSADSISATGLGKYRELGRPNVPGHIFAEFGDIESVKRTLDSEVAAIILEPIQSMAGIKCAPPLFFQELKSLCEQNGTLLIFDEVQTGIGRTGNWFFSASEAAGGVLPDIISLAKALGSGVPVSACLTTERVASQIKENDLGTTFGGGMLAMAALLATLDIIENEKLLENVRQVESYLRQHLLEIPGIKAVRGLGFLLGIEFERPASEIQKALLDKNIITGTSSDPKVLRLLPPLTLKHEEADLLIHSLSQVLS